MNNRTACPVAHLAVLGCLLLGGCVPVPFRPSATVTPVPVTPASAVPVVSAAARNSEAESVAKAIHQDEARVVLVEATAFSAGLGTSRTLTQVLATARTGHEVLAADYVLSVGHPLQRQLHDTGAAAPFLFFPVIVGYEKWQSMATLPATLIDVRDPQSLQVLCAASAYSEVATGLVYGFATIAMPEPGLRKALALEVAHRLADAQPSGDIHLLVVSQDYDTKTGAHDPICDAGASAPATTAALVH